LWTLWTRQTAYCAASENSIASTQFLSQRAAMIAALPDRRILGGHRRSRNAR
jgi:hypothetical protein